VNVIFVHLNPQSHLSSNSCTFSLSLSLSRDTRGWIRSCGYEHV